MNERQRWITPDLLRVLAAAGAWGFAYSCFYLLPKYLDREMDASPSGIGLVMGIFAIAVVALSPLAGRWLDRYSHSRMILVGSLLMSLSAIGFLVVDSVGPALLGLRVLQALSHALVFNAVGVAVADLAPPERLGQSLGLAGATTLVMNAVAPAVAEPISVIAGWNAVFVLAAVSGLFAAGLATRVRASANPTGKDAGSIFVVLRRPFARHYAAVITVAGLAFGTVFTFQQPFALELGRENVSAFFIAFAASAMIVRIFFGNIPDRFGRHRVATGALALYAAGSLGLAGAPSFFLEPLGAVFGLAHGLFYPAINAIAVGSVPRHERGRILAIFTGAFNLGFSATILLGVVAEGAGYPSVFGLSAGISAFGVLLLVGSPVLRAAADAGSLAQGEPQGEGSIPSP